MINCDNGCPDCHRINDWGCCINCINMIVAGNMCDNTCLHIVKLFSKMTDRMLEEMTAAVKGGDKMKFELEKSEVLKTYCFVCESDLEIPYRTSNRKPSFCPICGYTLPPEPETVPFE